MIPSTAEIIEGWTFVSRRLGRTDKVNRSAVEAAVREAADLARVETDEPPALFYAFARRPRAILGGWRVMPRLLAGMHCRRLGLRLNADADSLDRLRAQVVATDLAFDDVRSWFRKHSERITPPPAG